MLSAGLGHLNLLMMSGSLCGPHPGLQPRPPPTGNHLGVLGKKLWEMMINLTPLVVVVEESKSLSIISPNFFPKNRENSR